MHMEWRYLSKSIQEHPALLVHDWKAGGYQSVPRVYVQRLTWWGFLPLLLLLLILRLVGLGRNTLDGGYALEHDRLESLGHAQLERFLLA